MKNHMIIDGRLHTIKQGITIEHMQAKYPDKVITKASKPPSMKTLEKWVSSGIARATDGCSGIEPDGICQHGCESWLLVLGYI